MEELAGTLTESPCSSSDGGTPRDRDAIARTTPEVTIPFSVTILGPCSAVGSGDANQTFTSAWEVYMGFWECAHAPAAPTTARVMTRIQRRCAIRNRFQPPGAPGPRRNCREAIPASRVPRCTAGSWAARSCSGIPGRDHQARASPFFILAFSGITPAPPSPRAPTRPVAWNQLMFARRPGQDQSAARSARAAGAPRDGHLQRVMVMGGGTWAPRRPHRHGLLRARTAGAAYPRGRQRQQDEESVPGTPVGQVRVEGHQDRDDEDCREDRDAGDAPPVTPAACR